MATRLTQAFVLHWQGDYEQARWAYEDVLRMAPHQQDAVVLLAQLHHENGQDELALELLRAFARLREQLDPARRGPDDARLHQTLGRVCADLRLSSAAIRAFRHAARLAPNDADVRCGLGLAFAQQRRWVEAERALKQALRLDPRCVEAHVRLADLLRRLRRTDEAKELLRRLDRIEPNHPRTGFMLAACGGAEVPAQAPTDYLEAVFDGFAAKFDRNLRELKYRGPGLIEDMLARLAGAPAGQFEILDAGCGTGLCAPALKPYAARLVGVDLSAKMLDRARARGLYDELVVAELTSHLAGSGRRYDAVVAADVLVYFGELGEAFQAVANALRADGLFLFTAELHQAGDAPNGYRLESNGRYTHQSNYVERRLTEAGFRIERIDREVLRFETGQPVKALLVGARKDRGAASAHLNETSNF